MPSELSPLDLGDGFLQVTSLEVITSSENGGQRNCEVSLKGFPKSLQQARGALSAGYIILCTKQTMDTQHMPGFRNFKRSTSQKKCSSLTANHS